MTRQPFSRRHLLAGASALGGASLLPRIAFAKGGLVATTAHDWRPDRFMVIVAHPDDAEFLCAGTLLRLHAEHGWAVHVATMTAGDCGSAEHAPDEIAPLRDAGPGHAPPGGAQSGNGQSGNAQ